MITGGPFLWPSIVYWFHTKTLKGLCRYLLVFTWRKGEQLLDHQNYFFFKFEYLGQVQIYCQKSTEVVANFLSLSHVRVYECGIENHGTILLDKGTSLTSCEGGWWFRISINKPFSYIGLHPYEDDT